MKPQIFICYANEDKEKIDQIYLKLKYSGLNVWMDKPPKPFKQSGIGIGKNWETEIRKNIESSTFFLAFLSNNSINKKGYVQKEYRISLEMQSSLPDDKLFIIPIKLDDCEVPEFKINSICYSDLQWQIIKTEEDLNDIITYLNKECENIDNKLISNISEFRKFSEYQIDNKEYKDFIDELKKNDYKIKGQINLVDNKLTISTNIKMPETLLVSLIDKLFIIKTEEDFNYRDYYALGLSEYKKANYINALNHYNKCINLNNSFIDAYSDRAYCFIKLNKSNLAINDYSIILKLDSNNESARLSRGALYGTIGNFINAFKDFNYCIENFKNQALSYKNRGVLYSWKKDYKKAISDFSKSLIINPNDSSVYCDRGLTYYHLEEFENALKDLNKSIELKNDYDESYLRRGNVYFEKIEYENALKDYQKVLSINPKNVNAQNNIGNYYLIKGKYDDALKQYDIANSLDANYSKAYANRGNVFVKLKRYDDAIVQFNKSLKLDKQGDLMNVKTNIAETLIISGKYKKALKYINKLIIDIKDDESLLFLYFLKLILLKIFDYNLESIEKKYNILITKKTKTKSSFDNLINWVNQENNLNEDNKNYILDKINSLKKLV